MVTMGTNQTSRSARALLTASADRHLLLAVQEIETVYATGLSPLAGRDASRGLASTNTNAMPVLLRA
jgi:hypothetical protein